MNNQFEIAQAILSRPRMYVGNSPHIFTGVWNFMWGYDNAKRESGENGIFPPEFLGWAAQRLRLNHPARGLFDELVDSSSGDEKLAFDKFKNLVLSFFDEAKTDAESDRGARGDW